MFKKIILIIFSTLFSILLSYAIFYTYNFIFLQDNVKNTFQNKTSLDFHKKYSTKLHHLRGQIYNQNNSREYLFTTINNFENKKNTILLQGDSWAEQLNHRGREKYFIAENYIKKLSNLKKFGLINSGITSFSPILMNLQFQTLREDFNIKPNIVVSIIDQSDIGDENCRYKNKRIFKNSKLIAVNKDFFSDRPLDFTYIYRISDFILSHDNKFILTYKISNYKISHTIKTIFEKNLIKINYFIKNKKKMNYSKCYWNDIAKYLISPNNSEIEYFKSSLSDYINTIIETKDVDKFYIVSFPHKNHLKNLNQEVVKYKVNVSDIIDDLNINNNKFEHINFTKLIDSKQLIIDKDIYYLNDPSSHLIDEFYGNVFIKTIFEKIIKDF